MASCLTCEAEMGVIDVEIGEMLICDDCGAEHEVLSVKPLELTLVDDEEEDEEEEEGEDEDSEDEDEDDDDDPDEEDEEVSSAGSAISPSEA